MAKKKAKKNVKKSVKSQTKKPSKKNATNKRKDTKNKKASKKADKGITKGSPRIKKGIGANSEQSKGKRKPIKRGFEISKPTPSNKRGNSIKDAAKSGKGTRKGNTKAANKPSKKQSKKVIKVPELKPLKSRDFKKGDGVKVEFTSRVLQKKIEQVIKWDAEEIETYLKDPKKAFFKLQIEVPKEYKDKFKSGYRYDLVPTPPNFKFNKKNIKETIQLLISGYNNEILDYLDELEYDEAPKVWNLKSIGIEFIY